MFYIFRKEKKMTFFFKLNTFMRGGGSNFKKKNMVPFIAFRNLFFIKSRMNPDITRLPGKKLGSW